MNGFEGGQTPMHRRIPKRGFNHPSKIKYQAINVEYIEKKFDSGAEINGKALFEKGLLASESTPFKILAQGKISKSYKITANRFSKKAEDAVKKAGGSITAAGK